MSCCSPGPPRVPTFNLTCNVWFGNTIFPTFAAPSLAGLPCQLKPGDFVFSPFNFNAMYLCVPARTNIHWNRSGFPFGSDGVECPAGSGHYYRVAYVNDVGRGFSNEYRFALISDASPIPTPLP